MLRLTALSFGLAAGLIAPRPWQDPVPAPPPAPAPAPEAAPQIPAAAPAREPAGRPVRHPFEGVYLLRQRVIEGRAEARPSRGYLALTGKHLILCVAAPGPDPDLPLVRASVRTWTPRANTTLTTIQLGWFTDQDGTLHVEPPGTEEVRRIEPMRGGLRVLQDDRNWLEFERVE